MSGHSLVIDWVIWVFVHILINVSVYLNKFGGVKGVDRGDPEEPSEVSRDLNRKSGIEVKTRDGRFMY